MPEVDNWQIVLEEVPEERQQDTALFLSGCFSQTLNTSRSIAAAGPIALLSELTHAQAEAILAELSATLPRDVRLTLVDEAGSSRTSRLQWPRPPRIFGRELSDFVPRPESKEAVCPFCGNTLHVLCGGDGDVRVTSGLGEAKKSTAVLNLLPADKDPLFSGVKPLVAAEADFASLRSLQAGDTGFWMDNSSGESAEEESSFTPSAPKTRDTRAAGISKRETAKASHGLAAFMKPGVFAVVVGRTRDSQAVKIIAEIMGISEDEARNRCLALGLCVARDIALDEAQNLLARFNNLGTKARIIRPGT